MKHVGWEIQNEILESLAGCATRMLVHEVYTATLFSVIVDEVCDKGPIKELFICLRWGDQNYATQERWLKFCQLYTTNAKDI